MVRCSVMSSRLVEVSKFLSLILRHAPESVGLRLDSSGWASITELVRCADTHGRSLTRALVEQVVRENPKQRFSISADGTRIRANQGHSVPVDLGLLSTTPPSKLYHGTAKRFLASISREGLHRGSRQHVHLSADSGTATAVGARHGKPVVLSVRAREMHDARFSFFLSANGVWLTESVPAEFIDFPEDPR